MLFLKFSAAVCFCIASQHFNLLESQAAVAGQLTVAVSKSSWDDKCSPVTIPPMPNFDATKLFGKNKQTIWFVAAMSLKEKEMAQAVTCANANATFDGSKLTLSIEVKIPLVPLPLTTQVAQQDSSNAAVFLDQTDPNALMIVYDTDYSSYVITIGCGVKPAVFTGTQPWMILSRSKSPMSNLNDLLAKITKLGFTDSGGAAGVVDNGQCTVTPDSPSGASSLTLATIWSLSLSILTLLVAYVV